jgi:ubiquitin-protein ligase
VIDAMPAFDERRDQDVLKLRELQKQSRERIRVTRVSGRPPNEIEVQLHVKAAPSKHYPRAVQEVTTLTISLPARYPFVEPTVIVKTPILHPNIYSSGRICLGVKWVPSFGLDLLVRRVVQIVTYDPSILNEASPANGEALHWYRQTRQAHPGAFPTDTLTLAAAEPPKKIKWDNVSVTPETTVVSCPNCGAKLSLPAGKIGRVKCVRCGNSFEATT